MADIRCTCGAKFKFPYKLTNHIGMFILLDGNKDKHEPLVLPKGERPRD